MPYMKYDQILWFFSKTVQFATICYGSVSSFQKMYFFKGLLHPNLKLACFTCYDLKIINTYLKNTACILT